MRMLIAALCLAGCVSRPGTQLIAHKAAPAIPDALLYCGHSSANVTPFRHPVTLKKVADYANRLELSREILLADLELCDEKRRQLVDMIKGL